MSSQNYYLGSKKIRERERIVWDLLKQYLDLQEAYQQIHGKNSSIDFDFDVVLSEKPSMTLDMCIDTKANILIMEVTGFSPWSLEERMKICNALKEQMPECKIALVVDEKGWSD